MANASPSDADILKENLPMSIPVPILAGAVAAVEPSPSCSYAPEGGSETVLPDGLAS